jgi:phosphate transport system substrate-binding protein
LFKTARNAALALTTVSALIVGLAGTANAALPPANGTKEVLALAGSDTIVNVMGQISTDFNANTTFNPGPGKDVAVNMPPVLGTGGEFTVGGDGNCGPVTYATDPSLVPPDTHLPNGSSEGIAALHSDTTGCLDIARSSSDSATAGIDRFAFAKDAVSWAGFRSLKCPGSSIPCSPGTLTQQNLKDIYLCTKPDPKHPGQFKPVAGKWSNINPSLPAVKIQRFLPQTGSGTLKFFETTILGLSSAQIGVVDDSQCSKHPVRAEENSGVAVTTVLTTTALQAAAIFPYSFGQWTAQSDGAQPDLRHGATLGKLNNVTASVATIQNASFLGRRWVFNEIKPGSPSHDAAERFVGADDSDPTANGLVCSGAEASVITHFGFVPLPAAPLDPGSANTDSTCRLNVSNPPPAG